VRLGYWDGGIIEFNINNRDIYIGIVMGTIGTIMIYLHGTMGFAPNMGNMVV